MREYYWEVVPLSFLLVLNSCFCIKLNLWISENFYVVGITWGSQYCQRKSITWYLDSFCFWNYHSAYDIVSLSSVSDFQSMYSVPVELNSLNHLVRLDATLDALQTTPLRQMLLLIRNNSLAVKELQTVSCIFYLCYIFFSRGAVNTKQV